MASCEENTIISATAPKLNSSRTDVSKPFYWIKKRMKFIEQTELHTYPQLQAVAIFERYQKVNCALEVFEINLIFNMTASRISRFDSERKHS